MAGVDPNAGTSITTQDTPAQGGAEYRKGIGMEDALTAKVVASAHLTDGNRAEGVAYPENPGVGPFPAGTAMTDSTPRDDVN